MGLLPFARVALHVATAVLSRYRTPFSKHQFTQPPLLAVLCRMRSEDWTYREAEVRLREPAEWRRVLGLRSVPDYTPRYRFWKRLEEETIPHAGSEIARRFSATGRSRRRARGAVDATGLAQGASSTFFGRRQYHHTQRPLSWRHWWKWLTVVDLDRQLIVAQRARRGPWNDCAPLPAWGEAAPPQWSRLDWCWPMRSLTVSATIPASDKRSAPGV